MGYTTTTLSPRLPAFLCPMSYTEYQPAPLRDDPSMFYYAEEGYPAPPVAVDGTPMQFDAEWRGVKHRRDRRCRDVVFLVLFLAAVLGMIIVSAVAFGRGNPTTLKYAQDRGGLLGQWFSRSMLGLKKDVDVVAGTFCLSAVAGLAWVWVFKTHFTEAFAYTLLALGITGFFTTSVYLVVVGNRRENEGLVTVGWIMVVASFILVVMAFLLRRRIAMTVQLVKEACRGLNKYPSLFVVSALLSIVFAIFVAYWVAAMLYLSSIKEDESDEGFVRHEKTVRSLSFFMIAVGLWVTAFFSAVWQSTISGVIAEWYFSRTTPSGVAREETSAFASLGRAATTSAGSLALGSLVLSVIRFLNYLLHQTEKVAQKNQGAALIYGCCKCIFASLESFIHWFTRYVYIYVAMYGDSFCTSAYRVASLLSRNSATVAIVDVVHHFILFIGKLLGTALCVMIAVGVADSDGRDVSAITVGVVAAVSFYVLSFFEKIISTSTDTVLICYLEDLERNSIIGRYAISDDVHDCIQRAKGLAV